MKNSSLAIVGSGIKFYSHLTVETKTYIQQSQQVLYLVNEPAIETWINENNKNTKSLEDIYHSCKLRKNSYQKISNYIVDRVVQGSHVCVVLYGHPTIFARPALSAAQSLKAKNYDVKILPGISASDCLYADLMIDPGTHGCNHFETTDLIIRNRHLDIHAHTILWQPGVIGALGNPKEHDNKPGQSVLKRLLLQFYPRSHTITFYEAALYPHEEPKITQIKLNELDKHTISRLSTLYIPPTQKAEIDTQKLEELGITMEQLK